LKRKKLEKIAFGGGCHWCTEAVFQQIKGVSYVDQGFVASYGIESELCEGVIVEFDWAVISLDKLVYIHLMTHSSTSNHLMREKYRSAIYTFSKDQEVEVYSILRSLSLSFQDEIVTKVLPLSTFEPSDEKFRNYYLKDPQKPFCMNYIEPKFEIIRKQFPEDIKI